MEPPRREQHAVGEHRRRRGGGARSQDVANVCKQKGFAAGHEDFADAEFSCFAGDPLHPREAELPSCDFGRATHATIVAMQVAVEIRVEPKARADGAIGVSIRRSLSAPDQPPRAARLNSRIDQGVAREAAPSLKVGAETPFAANDG